MPADLTERIPDHLVDHWRNTALLSVRLLIGGITALSVPLFVALAWLPFRNGSGTQQLAVVCIAGITLFFAWCLHLVLLGRFITNAYSQSKLPIVSIAGDKITVLWRGKTIESTVSRCSIRTGRARQMKYASRKSGCMPPGNRELILIDLPPLYRNVFGMVRSYTTVAVGYTDESMAKWAVALGFGSEPSDAPKDRASRFENGNSTAGPR